MNHSRLRLCNSKPHFSPACATACLQAVPGDRLHPALLLRSSGTLLARANCANGFFR